jgi:hypothetical protein
MKFPFLKLLPALLLLPASSGATVVMAGAGAIANYRQEGSAAPVASTSREFPGLEFRALVAETSVTSQFTGGELTAPGSTTLGELRQGEGAEWTVSVDMQEIESWQQVFTDGAYTVTLTPKIPDGPSVVDPLGIPFAYSFGAYPPAPTVLNLPDLQALDASQNLTLSWNAWEGGTAEDTILVNVDNGWKSVFASPNPGRTGALDGTATTCTIPAGTLAPGDTYTVTIKFVHVLSSARDLVTGYPNAVVTTFQDSCTNFDIATSGVRPVQNLLAFSIQCRGDLAVNTLDGSVSSASLIAGNLTETVSASFFETSGAEAANVSLTGPDGSGITLQHPTDVSNEDNFSFYGFRDLTPFLPNGAYSLDLGPGRFLSTGSVDYAPQAEDTIIPAISLNIVGGRVKSISWEARKPDGSVTTFPDDETASFWVLAYHRAGFFPVFTNILGTQVTSIDLPDDGIVITELDNVNVTYNMSRNNEGTSNSAGMNLTVRAFDGANPFIDLLHIYGPWIVPQPPFSAGFGWMYDGSFPYVYCASLDMLANGGTYMGDGSGWGYIAAGASLNKGFFLYRYATGTWCWTNLNWHGWIYDYGKEGVAPGWIDITP